MRILLLDNYDSFTYNLLHLVEKISPHTVDVFKNDKISLDQIQTYHKIILSPGPGIPKNAGIMPQLLKHFSATKSIFGVCLGMQAIAENFQSPLRNLNTVFHGLATPLHIQNNDPLFKNCPNVFNVGRYHSWVIDETQITNVLTVTATDNQGLIMAIRHQSFDICGVQFHPESILSEYGETILYNWLNA